MSHVHVDNGQHVAPDVYAHWQHPPFPPFDDQYHHHPHHHPQRPTLDSIDTRIGHLSSATTHLSLDSHASPHQHYSPNYQPHPQDTASPVYYSAPPEYPQSWPVTQQQPQQPQAPPNYSVHYIATPIEYTAVSALPQSAYPYQNSHYQSQQTIDDGYFADPATEVSSISPQSAYVNSNPEPSYLPPTLSERLIPSAAHLHARAPTSATPLPEPMPYSYTLQYDPEASPYPYSSGSSSPDDSERQHKLPHVNQRAFNPDLAPAPSNSSLTSPQSAHPLSHSIQVHPGQQHYTRPVEPPSAPLPTSSSSLQDWSYQSPPTKLEDTEDDLVEESPVQQHIDVGPAPNQQVEMPPAVPAVNSASPVQRAPGAKAKEEKKPQVACYFCRRRKIACCAGPSGNKDVGACMPCWKRSLDCDKPPLSRRGHRKRAPRADEPPPVVFANPISAIDDLPGPSSLRSASGSGSGLGAPSRRKGRSKDNTSPLAPSRPSD
ncbi:hypothetical protein SISNIDRAFT_546293 [Sistotremastrum niveocremeum HHB9708]|uniref:Zn(2)-C6 fungal-type domain-containing protein n=1 Tax=Sistotremastrum niveocremeum HHB9708 TaxID=1314777 RepID=A0A165A0M2_9AGAM|nr:hypothetical protein SISNIDRAFT_546293 [Sistotremastrum niveocremeum HHB9708]